MKSRQLTFVLIALSSICFEVIGQMSAEHLSSVDQLFANWDGQSPGCAVGIIYQDQLIYEKGWGMEDVENKVKIHSESGFHIASMSKQFIAAGIGLLIIEGKLNLTDPISTYLPELSQVYQSITIEQLIHQTSGIKDYSHLLLFKGNKTDDFIPIETGIELLAKLHTLNFEPGSSHSYSNSNYLLLSAIVSRVSKMDFRTYIHQEIFLPLQMSDTYFINHGMSGDKQIAKDYQQDREKKYREYRDNLMAAEDQIVTTIRDLYAWNRNFTTKEVGGADLQNILLTKGKLSTGKEIPYAAGLYINTYKGLTTISHSGDMGGYHSQYLQFPEEEVSIIILANASDVNAYGMSYQVADIVLEDQFHVNDEQMAHKQSPTIQLSNKELKKYRGAYWNARANRPRIIYLRDDTLRYNRPDIYESPIVPIGDNQFRLLNQNQKQSASIEFVFEGNDLKRMVFQSVGDEPISMQKYVYPTVKGKQLHPYTGRYYSEELDITYELKQDKTNVAIWVKGEKVSTLVVLKADVFKDGYLGDFRFVRNDEHQIIGLYLDRQRARDMYFKKVGNE
ncbi:MAG: serine hydrolase domain-containing protein [Bacteroidota bacterium]